MSIDSIENLRQPARSAGKQQSISSVKNYNSKFSSHKYIHISLLDEITIKDKKLLFYTLIFSVKL